MTNEKRTAGVRVTERPCEKKNAPILYRILDFVASLCLVFDVDWEEED